MGLYEEFVIHIHQLAHQHVDLTFYVWLFWLWWPLIFVSILFGIH